MIYEIRCPSKNSLDASEMHQAVNRATGNFGYLEQALRLLCEEPPAAGSDSASFLQKPVVNGQDAAKVNVKVY